MYAIKLIKLGTYTHTKALTEKAHQLKLSIALSTRD